MMRAPRRRWPSPLLASLLLLVAPNAALAQTGPARGLAGVAQQVRLDRIVVKLVPEAALRSHETRGRSFAQAMGDPAARSLDDALERCGARGLRRVFRSFEDRDGRPVDTTRARIARLRAARRRPLAPAPDPAKIPDLENFFVADIPAASDAEALDAILRDLRANEWVAAAQPDFVYSVLAEPLPDVSYVPGDPFLSPDGNDWSEGSFGNAFPDLYGLRNVRALEAWALFDEDGSGSIDGTETGPGQGVVVAVIDTGIDAGHPDISANVWTNPGEIPGNGVDDDGNGFVDDAAGWNFVSGSADPADGNGHGTHVSGTIAAVANSEGIVGVAPFAKVMPLKGLSDAGSGSSSSLAPAIDYAALMQADVTSNSWGGLIVDALIQDAFAAAEASGVLNVAAAGNDGSARLLMPARFPSTMAIAALDWNDRLASFSNFGVGVELGAPGRLILSLSANDHDNALVDANPSRAVSDRYMVISGTSMATPHASGAAAVLMSRFPADQAIEIRGRLLSGAANVDAANPGREGAIGAGRVDLLASSLAVSHPLIQLVRSQVAESPGGRTQTIEVDLRNFWSAASDVTAALTSADPDVQVRQGLAHLGALAPGEVKTASFVVRATGLAPGTEVSLSLAIEDGDGGQDVLILPFRSPFFEDATEGTSWVPSDLVANGTVATDFDHDGATDFVVGELSRRMRFFHNERDGTFSLVQLGQTLGRQPLFFDMDGDGDRDLLAIAQDSQIARNDGAGNFTLEPVDPTLRIEQRAGTTVLDVDGDGDLDMVSTSQSFAAGHTLFLFQNDGAGNFTDVHATSGLGNLRSEALLAIDYDDDGDSDLITGEAERIAVFRNDGLGFFTAMPGAILDPPTDCAPFAGCTGGGNIAAGDYDNDGDVDVFTAGGTFLGTQPAFLMQNQGDGTFRDVTAAAGILTVDFKAGASGTSFFDLENDGDLDLFVSFDNVLLGSPERSLEPTNVLFRNNGDGTFTHVSSVAFPVEAQIAAFHAALADFDGDGGIDLFGAAGSTIIETGGLLRNVATRQAWIELELIATESPTDGYGARIFAVADGRIHRRDVHHSPMDLSVVHIGLGAAETIDTLDVHWPSGIVQHLTNLPVDQRRILREMESSCGADGDFDADGVCNSADNCLVHANGPWDPSPQADADGDGFGNACDADLDNDGAASMSDVSIVLLSVGLSPGDPGYVAAADLDGDGVVSFADVRRVLAAYGSAQGPSGLACADPTGSTAPCPGG